MQERSHRILQERHATEQAEQRMRQRVAVPTAPVPAADARDREQEQAERSRRAEQMRMHRKQVLPDGSLLKITCC